MQIRSQFVIPFCSFFVLIKENPFRKILFLLSAFYFSCIDPFRLKACFTDCRHNEPVTSFQIGKLLFKLSLSRFNFSSTEQLKVTLSESNERNLDRVSFVIYFLHNKPNPPPPNLVLYFCSLQTSQHFTLLSLVQLQKSS